MIDERDEQPREIAISLVLIYKLLKPVKVRLSNARRGLRLDDKEVLLVTKSSMDDDIWSESVAAS
jgi:hypothetical protein